MMNEALVFGVVVFCLFEIVCVLGSRYVRYDRAEVFAYINMANIIFTLLLVVMGKEAIAAGSVSSWLEYATKLAIGVIGIVVLIGFKVLIYQLFVKEKKKEIRKK